VGIVSKYAINIYIKKMILEFKIDEQDFLDYQLFAASKSVRISKRKRDGWIVMTVGPIFVAISFYFTQNIAMVVFFGIAAIICGIFYPKYFNWRYKKHYKTYIKENYPKRFGQIETLEINNDNIFFKDKTGEGKINLSEFECVDETSNHFFVKVSTGVSLIIPKKGLNNNDEIRKKFNDLELTVNDETNWRWK
jgi:hypothetical protein